MTAQDLNTPAAFVYPMSYTDREVREKIQASLKLNSSKPIPLRGEKSFQAQLTPKGVHVDNLGASSLLPWADFLETVRFLEQQGGRALKGNATDRGGRLGTQLLPIDSIEGHLAHINYGKTLGDSVFRRIVPIAHILTLAGICRNGRGYLELV